MPPTYQLFLMRQGGSAKQPDECLWRETLRPHRRIEPHLPQLSFRESRYRILELLAAAAETRGHERAQRACFDVHDQWLSERGKSDQRAAHLRGRPERTRGDREQLLHSRNCLNTHRKGPIGLASRL